MFPNKIQQDKGKQILTKPEKPKDLGDEIANIINRAYVKKTNWNDEEHEIKIIELMEIQESIAFKKATNEHQLDRLYAFLDKLEEENK